jgi:hypothetical protein
MKTIIFILTFFTGIFQACQKRALPIITNRTTEPSKPVAVVHVKPDTAIGKAIFTTRCSRCHTLPEPAQFTAQRWDGILVIMVPRVRLDQERKMHLTAYIKANCIR